MGGGMAIAAATTYHQRFAAVASFHGGNLATDAPTSLHLLVDGLPLDRAPFELRPSRMSPEVVVGVRIGISKAKDMPWRFGLHGSRFVSRRFT